MKKRLLSIFLALSMLFTTVPANAVFAEDLSGTQQNVIEGTDKEGADKEVADKEGADKEGADEEGADKEVTDKEDADKEDTDKEGADKEDTDKEGADKEDTDKDAGASEQQGTPNNLLGVVNAPVATAIDDIYIELSPALYDKFIQMSGLTWGVLSLAELHLDKSSTDFINLINYATGNGWKRKFHKQLVPAGMTTENYTTFLQDSGYSSLTAKIIGRVPSVYPSFNFDDLDFEYSLGEDIWDNTDAHIYIDLKDTSRPALEQRKIQFIECGNSSHDNVDVKGTYGKVINADSNPTHVWTNGTVLYTDESMEDQYEQPAKIEQNKKKIYEACKCGFELDVKGESANQVYVFYHAVAETPVVKDQNAGFYIRLSDRIIPLETGTTKYGNELYSGHPGIMFGKVTGPEFVANAEINVEEDGYSVSDLQTLFAEVNAKIIGESAPNAELINKVLQNQKTPSSFDPETQTVIWYVVKNQCNDTTGDAAHQYHVDGIIVNNDSMYYTLEYHANVGDDENVPAVPTLELIKAGETANVRYDIGSRPGYEFLGWSTSSTGAVEYAKDTHASLLMDQNRELYAVWKSTSTKRDVTLSYDKNATDATGRVDSQKQSVTNDANATFVVTSDRFERPNFEFLGWNTDKNATAATIKAGAAYVTNKDTTLYAIWESAPAKHNVTLSYDKNATDATGSMNPQTNNVTVDTDAKFTVAPNGFERPNFEFVGWSTEEGATNTATIQAGAEYVTKEDTTLYAVWKVKTHKISLTYHSNFGGNEKKAEYSEDISVIDGKHTFEVVEGANGFVNSGYTFAGWSYDPNGDNLCTDKEIETSDNVNLYAQWEAIPYTITYHSNLADNKSETDEKTYTVKEEVTLRTVNPFTNPDTTKKFMGWSTVKGDNTAATVEKHTMEAKNADFYAIWTDRDVENEVPYYYQINKYITLPDGTERRDISERVFVGKVIFYTDDVVTSKTISYDEFAEINGYTLTKPAAIEVNSTDESVVFIAEYRKTVYQVTYHANNGTDDTANDTNANNYYDVGATPALYTSNPFSRTGYTFDGWSLTANGAKIDTLSAITDKSLDVYARWTANYVPPVDGGDNDDGGNNDSGNTGGNTPNPGRPLVPGVEDITDEETPLANPETPVEEILDDETPLANLPEDEDLILIDDEEVPLANAPKTGSSTSGFAAATMIGLAALVVLFKKKRSN